MNGGRVLTCTICRAAIRVHEIPAPFIDPRLYVGAVCGCLLAYRAPEPEHEQLALVEVELQETRRYDPTIAAIPF